MAVYSINGDGKLVRSFYLTFNFHSTTKFSHMTDIDHSVVKENGIAMGISWINQDYSIIELDTIARTPPEISQQERKERLQ